MREKLIDICKQANDELRLRYGASTWGDFVDILIANDVVPVVRCKDCKYYNERNEDCDHPALWAEYCSDFGLDMKPDDFCSYGERREGE